LSSFSETIFSWSNPFNCSRINPFKPNNNRKGIIWGRSSKGDGKTKTNNKAKNDLHIYLVDTIFLVDYFGLNGHLNSDQESNICLWVDDTVRQKQAD